MNSVSHYSPLSPNSRAVRICHSYCQAASIPVRISNRPHCDLAVTAKDGTTLDVAIVMSPQTDELADGPSITLLASDVASPKLEVALEAFHILTEEAGYGRPIPVDRGEKHKVYGNDMFLIVARHTEYQRAPDMSREKLARYMPVIQRACKRFMSMNAKLLRMHMYEMNDLISLSIVWTTIFAHSSEILSPTQEEHDDNERLLTKHLKSQFFHFYTKLLGENAKQFPDPDTVSIALKGHVLDENHSIEKVAVDPRTEGEPVVEEKVETQAAVARRRDAARIVLDRMLAALPHDEMLKKLRREYENTCRDDKTREYARQRLIDHAKECDACLGAKFPPVSQLSVRAGKNVVEERGEGEARVYRLCFVEGPAHRSE